jgi:hypothetical protein
MDKTRFSGIFDASRLSVSLIGAGGIGAMTGLVLAKMGIGFLSIYDDDYVSDENIPTQFHQLSYVGKSKVEALKDTIFAFADDTVLFANHTRIKGEFLLADQLVISSVDSLTARQDIWQALGGNVLYYIDARMAAEEFHAYFVCMNNSDNAYWYKQQLFALEEEEIPDLPCTAKATMYTAAIAAGHLGSMVRKLVTGQAIPWYTIHHIPSNTITQIGGGHETEET